MPLQAYGAFQAIATATAIAITIGVTGSHYAVAPGVSVRKERYSPYLSLLLDSSKLGGSVGFLTGSCGGCAAWPAVLSAALTAWAPESPSPVELCLEWLAFPFPLPRPNVAEAPV